MEQARADYLDSEAAVKAAGVDLHFQSVQHEKAMASLRSEINSLQKNSQLEGTVADLTERNNEMEQLLQAKCLEIEENDDRVIECVHLTLIARTVTDRTSL